MAINTSNYTLDFLPAVPLVEAFSYVGPNNLSSLSKVNKHFCLLSKENSIWKVVANKIGLPLTKISEKNSALNQVRTHIVSLKKEIKELEEPLPEDIAGIIVSKSIPSFEEIQLLKDYRKARDIIVVWTKLDLNSVPVIAIEQPAKVMIAQANQFTNWFAQNKNNFANLTTLDLDYKQLSFLPSEICQLTQLQSLNISNNQISSLPSEIGQLTQLQRLYLINNQLSSLPSEIGLLTQLLELYLINNQLSSLPPEIGLLTQLRTLSLCFNNISTLPSEICGLTQLLELYLGHNQLSSLPSEIGLLTQLQRLYLINNQLSSLPPEICGLTQLQLLYLSNNQFSTLPSEISQLNLNYFSFEGNPLSKTEYLKSQALIYKKEINFMKKAIVGISLATLAYYYPTEIISGLGNSLPYVSAISAAVAVQRLVHRYFQ